MLCLILQFISQVSRRASQSSCTSSCLNNIFLSFFRWLNTFPFVTDLLTLPYQGSFRNLGLGYTLLLVTTRGHGNITGGSVVVVTMVCKSLYFLLYDLLRSFCLFSSVYRPFIAFAVMGVVDTKLVIHFPTTGS